MYLVSPVDHPHLPPSTGLRSPSVPAAPVSCDQMREAGVAAAQNTEGQAMKKIKVKFSIDGLIHNLSHAEFPERLNEIQDELRAYGHIVAESADTNPAWFIVEYEHDGWDARGEAEEMLAS